jgi:hypothetical protein
VVAPIWVVGALRDPLGGSKGNTSPVGLLVCDKGKDTQPIIPLTFLPKILGCSISTDARGDLVVVHPTRGKIIIDQTEGTLLVDRRVTEELIEEIEEKFRQSRIVAIKSALVKRALKAVWSCAIGRESEVEQGDEARSMF